MRSNMEYGVVTLLDALGIRERIQDDIDSFLTNWDSVLPIRGKYRHLGATTQN
jgi:hypothetical protein